MEHLRNLALWVQSQPLWVKVQVVASLTLLMVLTRVMLENYFISSTNDITIFLAKYSSIFLAAIVWFGYTNLTKKP